MKKILNKWIISHPTHKKSRTLVKSTSTYTQVTTIRKINSKYLQFITYIAPSLMSERKVCGSILGVGLMILRSKHAKTRKIHGLKSSYKYNDLGFFFFSAYYL